MTDVKVRFSADDQATEVARKLLEVMKGLDREQRAAAAATNGLAKPTRDAATGFERMRTAIVGLRNTGGVDAISKRVAILAQGLTSASTRAQSLTRLTAAEGQLQRALAAGNLTLEQRITLERTLRQVQSTIAGGSGLTSPTAAIAGFQRLTGILGALGVTLSALSFGRFVKDAIDAADALGELSQRTGASTESLSVLADVAEKSGSDTATLATGLRNLARQVEALRQGNVEARETFRALGLSAADLEGLSIDQIFIRVADAQAKFADGSGKVTAAVRLFGRAGDELIPTLNTLANGGFARSREELERLGAVIGGDAARQADEFNDKMADLRRSGQGLALLLGTTLIPALTAFADRVIAIVRAIREFREKVPQAGRDLSAFTGGAVGAFTGFSALLGPGGDVPLAAETTGGKILELTKRLLGLKTAADAARESARDILPTLAPVVVTAPDRPDVNLADPAAARAARQAELTAAAQHARDLLAVEQASIAQQAQANEARFAQGLSSIAQYYAARVAIAQRGTQAELRTLEAEKARLQSSPLAEDTQAARIQRSAEVKSLEEQIARVKIEGATALATLDEQRRVATKAALAELGSLQAQLFRAQGEDLKAAQIEIAQAADRFAETLRSQGFGTAVVADLRTAFSTLFTDKAAFDAQQRAAEREFQQLAIQRAAIQEQARQGVISERDAQLQILGLERERLPALRQAADLMQAFAERVGDPALLAAAAQIRAQLDGMGVAIQESTRLAANFGSNLRDAAQGEVANFLGSTINEVESLGDAFRQLGAAIAGSFQRIAAEILATKLFEKIGGLFGANSVDSGAVKLGAAATALTASAGSVTSAGATVGAGAISLGTSAGSLATSGGILLSAAAALTAAAAALAAAGTGQSIASFAQAGLGAARGALGFASGGYVRGPGTGTSDSIPARLSHGEFVQPARVTRYYGVEGMEAIRRMAIPREVLINWSQGLRTPPVRSIDSVGVPKFAEGGLVVQPQAAPTTTSRTDTLRAVLELSPDLVVRELTSTRGVKALTQLMQRHKSQFRAALG